MFEFFYTGVPKPSPASIGLMVLMLRNSRNHSKTESRRTSPGKLVKKKEQSGSLLARVRSNKNMLAV